MFEEISINRVLVLRVDTEYENNSKDNIPHSW